MRIRAPLLLAILNSIFILSIKIISKTWKKINLKKSTKKHFPNIKPFGIIFISISLWSKAGVAQLVEQLICNQSVMIQVSSLAIANVIKALAMVISTKSILK